MQTAGVGLHEDQHLHPLQHTSSSKERGDRYKEVVNRLKVYLEEESDLVAAMATIACELHHSFAYYSWTGFYRAVSTREPVLVIGPYQGTHGCLRIPFTRGVCGAAARTRETQVVPDVHAFLGHIACASSTQSEVVVPIIGRGGDLLGVLDVDSELPAAFTDADKDGLQEVCMLLEDYVR